MNFYNRTVQSPENEYPPKLVVKLCKLIGFCISKVCWRLTFSGVENIPQDSETGLVIAANHPTYFDPVWVCLKVDRKFRFMAWNDVFNWFFLGRLIKYLGAFPVGLNHRDFVKATRTALHALKNGATLIIFPEAEREFSDGKLLPFKSGAIRLAIDAGVPILPVTIRGANKVWPQDQRFPRFGKVKVIYHPAITFKKPETESDGRRHISELNDQLVKIISSEL